VGLVRLSALGQLATINQGLNTSGRGAGARPGDWQVRVASVGNIRDDRLALDDLEVLAIDQNARTEKHLLRPDDVLITARSTVVKVALVPPAATRTVADATLLVVRAHDPGVGPYLWWFLASAFGRRQVEARMSGSTTLLSLSAGALGEVVIPLPRPRELTLIADLAEVSERAYAAATEAARLRRTLFRDAIIDRLRLAAGATGAGR